MHPKSVSPHLLKSVDFSPCSFQNIVISKMKNSKTNKKLTKSHTKTYSEYNLFWFRENHNMFLKPQEFVRWIVNQEKKYDDHTDFFKRILRRFQRERKGNSILFPLGIWSFFFVLFGKWVYGVIQYMKPFTVLYVKVTRDESGRYDERCVGKNTTENRNEGLEKKKNRTNIPLSAKILIFSQTHVKWNQSILTHALRDCGYNMVQKVSLTQATRCI